MIKSPFTHKKVNKNASLALMAFKSNVSHVGSYMLNPLPGLMYVSIVYPLKTFESQTSEELSSRVHLMSLRIIQDLASSSNQTSESTLNLIQLSTIERIFKKVSDLYRSVASVKPDLGDKFTRLFDKSMENLGQLLIMCSRFGLMGFGSDEVKNLYLKYLATVPPLTPVAQQVDQLNVYFQLLFNS